MLYLINPKSNFGKLTLDKLYPLSIDTNKGIKHNLDFPDSGSEYDKQWVRNMLSETYYYLSIYGIELFFKNMNKSWFDKFIEIMINKEYSENLLNICISSMFGKLLFENVLSKKESSKAGNWIETFSTGRIISKHDFTKPIPLTDYIGFSSWLKYNGRFKDILNLMEKFKNIDESPDIEKLTRIWNKVN